MNQINQQIAVDMDYLIDNSKNINVDMKTAVKGLAELFKIPETDVQKIAMYHVVNINKYNHHYHSNIETFVN